MTSRMVAGAHIGLGGVVRHCLPYLEHLKKYPDFMRKYHLTLTGLNVSFEGILEKKNLKIAPCVVYF